MRFATTSGAFVAVVVPFNATKVMESHRSAVMALESLRQSDLWKTYWATRLTQTI